MAGSATGHRVRLYEPHTSHGGRSLVLPVAEGMKLLGQAGTVTCMAGGNSAAHVAIAMARPGEVHVIDAGGFEDAAIWGGIMTRAAVGLNLGDLVVGDDDGVCVVPLERADTILAASL